MRITLDTSALVRFFTKDIPQKAILVRNLLKEREVSIPDVVFPELEYVLKQDYSFHRTQILEIYKVLTSQENISTTRYVKNAIIMYEETMLDMADCIIAAHSFKGKLASFDSGLLKVKGVKRFWR